MRSKFKGAQRRYGDMCSRYGILSVTWPQVTKSRLVFTGYRPVAHFSRAVTSPVMRLTDLEPVSSGAK